MAPHPIPGGGLSVIALVSGGKDSFFSALHCLENGHRLVALANLHPPCPGPALRYAGPGKDSVPASASAGTQGSDLAPPAPLDRATPGPDREAGAAGEGASEIGATIPAIAATSPEHDETTGESAAEIDLNSFMYQTVGHQVIPLYAEATGVPLYRRAIRGGALQSQRDYSTAAVRNEVQAANRDDDEDETESMIPLLQSVIREHPEANALSAGAILSTYQRTRVESVALRLGLTPLAYLWKYPVLPPPLSTSRDEAQLLFDMAAVGLEARVIKVASGGLDESFLWEMVASARGIMRLKKAMGRFGSAGMDTGAVIGEGGEFETLVVDGPKRLFKKRVVVPENARITVREGGGTAWLSFGPASLEEKDVGEEEEGQVRKPDLLDARFVAVLESLQTSRQEGIHEEDGTKNETSVGSIRSGRSHQTPLALHQRSNVETWAFTGSQMSILTSNTTIQEETTKLIRHVQSSLAKRNLAPSCILSTIVVLRSMADFPAINAVYGFLFPDPNPPSRVTISCGDLLPPSSGNIAVYLTLSSSSSPEHNRRDGLHVQSRSYWAPANIGPYSQAITFPASLLSPPSSPADSDCCLPSFANSSNGSRIVHIAGQIPLVPASMEFLPMKAAAVAAEEQKGQGGGLEMQLVLSLQHLWRIGVEMGLQWWTSAAVYFPSRRNEDSALLSARARAWLAWKAWTDAHEWGVRNEGDEDEDDEDGPDLWDRKFNPKYMSYADEAGGKGGNPDLPDYSLFDDDDDDDKTSSGAGRRRCLPFFFAVEVDELPRSAEAEWHAHAGLSGMVSGADSLSTWRTRGNTEGSSRCSWEVNHCILTSTVSSDPDSDDDRDDKEVVASLHSIVAIETAAPQDTTTTTTKTTLKEALSQTNKAFCTSLEKTLTSTDFPQGQGQEDAFVSNPYLVYVDTAEFSPEEITTATTTEADGGLAVVPCRSIYGGGSRGARLSVVVLYRHFLSATSGS